MRAAAPSTGTPPTPTPAPATPGRARARRAVAAAAVVGVTATALTGLAAVAAGPAAAAPAPPGVLPVDTPLTVGATVSSANGLYTLAMQDDGNLVEYGGGRALWASGTRGSGAVSAVIQGDGNLVLYTAARLPAWATYTFDAAPSPLVVGGDGGLTVRRGDGSELWGAHPVVDRLPAGTALGVGQSLLSVDGQYRLSLQADGNLVLYAVSGVPVWWTGTAGAMSRLAMQTDGNLVLYRADGLPVWFTGRTGRGDAVATVGIDVALTVSSGSPATVTWRSPGRTDVLFRNQTLGPDQSISSGTWTLVMQGDGNLVRYDAAGRPGWWTNSFVPGSHLSLQSDGNLVVYTPAGVPIWWTGTDGTSATVLRISPAGLVHLADATRVPQWIEGPPNWTALARCESGGNPRAVNPAGYYGLYQFDQATWTSNGGPGSPLDASPALQTAVASTLYLARGRQPWPVCGVNL